MSELITIIAAVGIAGYVIARQVIGEPLRGKRVVVLPLVLAIIGAVDLHSSTTTMHPADVVCLAIGAVVAAAIGAAQGAVMRLEARNGSLWGQLPVKALSLWLLLVVSRVTIVVVAHGLNAKLAASGAAILLTLGINRLSQAAVVVARAKSAGIPFAPEKDGSSFMAGFIAKPTMVGTSSTGSRTLGSC